MLNVFWPISLWPMGWPSFKFHSEHYGYNTAVKMSVLLKCRFAYILSQVKSFCLFEIYKDVMNL